MNASANLFKNAYDSFKTVSNLQLAQLFVFLVPIYKLTYHYFYDPQPGNLGHQVIQKVSNFDFDSWDNMYTGNVQVFKNLQYAFIGLLIVNLVHIVRYSVKKEGYYNTLIGTSSFSYRVAQGDINLLSGTLLVPLVLSIKFLINQFSTDSNYWLSLLTLSLLNSFLLLSNVIINTLKLDLTKKLSLWSLINLGLVIGLQYYSNETNMLMSLIYLTINQTLVYLTVTLFTRNFSLSEASILSQFVSGLAFDYYQSYFDSSNYNLDVSDIFILIRAGLVFASIGVYSTVGLRKLVKFNGSCALIFFAGIVCPWWFLIYPSIVQQLRQNPFNWLINYIWESKQTQYIIVFWALSILSSIIYINYQTKFNSLNLKRKFFHYLSCIMFIPIYSYNIEFLNLALMVGVGFMLIVEIYRLSYLPGYSTLNKFINSFRDGKDIGEFVWAHVYLLLGCSLTIWLGELGGLSGVIALGLCDSTASIVGKSVGRTKWFDSKKSVEGSLVFMICCTLGMIYTCEAEFGNNASLVAKAAFYTGLLEAVTIENDNLIIPLYLWVLLNLPN